jgi:hypothetical protein
MNCGIAQGHPFGLPVRSRRRVVGTEKKRAKLLDRVRVVEARYRDLKFEVEPPEKFFSYNFWQSAGVDHVTLGEDQHTIWSSFLTGNGHTFGDQDLDDSRSVDRAVYVTGKQYWIRR